MTNLATGTGSGTHSFHNTTNQSTTELKTSEDKARTQDEIVLEFFKQHKLNDFTPCEVYEALIKQKKITRLVPITSIRRAITNLTHSTKDDLEKMRDKRIGYYGAPNNVWRLNRTKYKVAVQTELFN